MAGGPCRDGAATPDGSEEARQEDALAASLRALRWAGCAPEARQVPREAPRQAGCGEMQP